MRLLLLLGAGMGALFLTACRSSGDHARPSTGSPPESAEADPGISLYEQRLLDAIEDLRALDAAAAQYDEEDRDNIERRFRQVANAFNSIIASNPDGLEARLIYGKLLDRYGDRSGALEQFAEVIDRDPTIAVAHQQVGTYFAEEGEFAKALAYYLNAVAAAPEESAYHYSLGDLLYTFRPGFIEEGIFTAERLDETMLEAFRAAAALAPDDLRLQFRYGEAFADLADPAWETALAHWETLSRHDDLTPLQRDAALLHRARSLGELERYREARELLAEIEDNGLAPSKEALLAALDEAEAR
ncbi:MAG: tetratricopeptide repeat protein [Opitutales bacterium]